MNELSRSPISDLLADHALINEAIRQAIHEAVARHARAGQPVATWQDGKVVWLAAEEVLPRLCHAQPA
jgi:hypothetical protein